MSARSHVWCVCLCIPLPPPPTALFLPCALKLSTVLYCLPAPFYFIHNTVLYIYIYIPLSQCAVLRTQTLLWTAQIFFLTSEHVFCHFIDTVACSAHLDMTVLRQHHRWMCRWNDKRYAQNWWENLGCLKCSWCPKYGTYVCCIRMYVSPVALSLLMCLT